MCSADCARSRICGGALCCAGEVRCTCTSGLNRSAGRVVLVLTGLNRSAGRCLRFRLCRAALSHSAGETAATTDFVCRVRCVVLDGGKSTQLLTTFTCTAGDAMCMCAPPVSPSFRILALGVAVPAFARARNAPGASALHALLGPSVEPRAISMLCGDYARRSSICIRDDANLCRLFAINRLHSAPTYHLHSSQCAPLHTPLLLSHVHRSVFTGNPHLCDA